MLRIPSTFVSQDSKVPQRQQFGPKTERANVVVGPQLCAGVPDIDEIPLCVSHRKRLQVVANAEKALKLTGGIRYSILVGYHDSWWQYQFVVRGDADDDVPPCHAAWFSESECFESISQARIDRKLLR